MTRASDVSPGFVAQKRSMNASWGAIARMTGAPEIDLRRLYGGLVIAAETGSALDGASAADRVRKALTDAGLSPIHARIITRLWRANGGRMVAAALTQGLMVITAQGGGDSDSIRINLVKAARVAAAGLGIEFAHPARGSALSVTGLTRISEIAGLKPRLDVAA